MIGVSKTRVFESGVEVAPPLHSHLWVSRQFQGGNYSAGAGRKIGRAGLGGEWEVATVSRGLGTCRGIGARGGFPLSVKRKREGEHLGNSKGKPSPTHLGMKSSIWGWGRIYGYIYGLPCARRCRLPNSDPYSVPAKRTYFSPFYR